MSDDQQGSIPIAQVNEALDTIMTGVEERYKLLERRLETMEQLHGKLAIAYAELASTVELLIAEVMSPRSDEEKDQFRKDIQERFADTLSLLHKATNDSARRNPDNYLDEAMARMAKNRQDSTPDE